VAAGRNAIVLVMAAMLTGFLYHNNNSSIPFSLTSNITSGFPSWSPPQFEAASSNETLMSVSDTFRVSVHEGSPFWVRKIKTGIFSHYVYTKPPKVNASSFRYSQVFSCETSLPVC